MSRRRSVRRVLEPRTATLPPMGWVVTDPADPPYDCSWCGRPLDTLPSGVIVCGHCDCLPRQHTPTGVIS